MNINELPSGNFVRPVALPHFPSRWQAFLWRNWGLVPVSVLAEILQCEETVLQTSAEEMGLPPHPDISPKWLTHGYLTLIRNNWHLLPYEQLLQLLDWKPEQMAYALKEEDFLWHKLGQQKPVCPSLRYHPLTSEQKKGTEFLRNSFLASFPASALDRIDPPFAFAERYAPVSLPPGEDRFEFNFIHSYAASCGDVLGNFISHDPIPENLLAQYSSMGIRGIWFHAILYLLVPIPGAEEFSAGCEERLRNLQTMTDRCEKYGIKVYLYLNEPRCLPMDFYRKKPDWAGIPVPKAGTRTICTTRSPEPLQWLENAVRTVFRRVENLGGAFCITMSENPTHCNCRLHKAECPSCSGIPGQKIIADIISAMERGMHAANPQAKMIAYDWSWTDKEGSHDNFPFKKAVMDLLPKNLYIATVSEWGTLLHLGGKEVYLVDYSISKVGPSQETLRTWSYARSIGLKTAAKVQINNSWELSAVPYIPVPYLIQEHLNNLKKAHVSGLLLSWTLGGFPGGNLSLLNQTPEETAAGLFHPELAAIVCRAWHQFSEAFRHFPFSLQMIYTGPMNFGPMNLLHLKATGHQATMIGFPYDDLESWCRPYPPECAEEEFRRLTEGWRQGLAELSEVTVLPEEQSAFAELQTIARAAYCHFRSSYLQIRFIRARNLNFNKKIMTECLDEEITLAISLHEILRRDSRIGFEASNHYYYTLNDLREKVISCRYLLQQLQD